MRILYSDKDEQGAGETDLTGVVKALTAERDAIKKDLDNRTAESAKLTSALEAARKSVVSVYHQAETAQAVHPNALTSMPSLELDEEFRPTKASQEARAKWWAENAWAKKPAQQAEAKPDGEPAVKPPQQTPAPKPDASGQDLAYWRKLRREDPVEFKRRGKEYDAFCESEDRKKGIV